MFSFLPINFFLPLPFGGKSGGELVTLFGGYSYDGVSVGIWVIHRGPKSGGSR